MFGVLVVIPEFSCREVLDFTDTNTLLHNMDS